MAYTTAEGRQELLDGVAQAVEALGVALAALGEAYEALDERMADRLEEQLFRPVQVAYGRAKRAHAQFAGRVRLASPPFAAGSSAPSSRGVRGAIDTAVAALGRADAELAGLQDSMLPVEVGDAELRADLAAIRTAIGHLPARARELERSVGR